VTDGASVNIGEKNGLWVCLKEERKASPAEQNTSPPLVTIWCAVHRSSLAWKAVTQSVLEIKHLIDTSASISTYFHESGLRTREIKMVAKKNELKLRRFPRYFEVRWCEFTHSLLDKILTSWSCLILYFDERSKDEKENAKTKSTCRGYYQFLTKEENIKLMANIADMLSVYSHFQKRMQSDSLTVVDIPQATHSVKTQLEQLKTQSLIGGWMCKFTENLKDRNEEENSVLWHGIKLQAKTKKKKK